MTERSEPANLSRPRPARVFLVDDHAVVRQGLRQLLEQTGNLQVCGEAAEPVEAMRAIEADPPDLAVVDLSLGPRSGFDLLGELAKRAPGLPVLVLSMHEEPAYVERSLRLGAKGYVMKKEASESVIEAIDRLLQGDIYVSPELKDKLIGRFVGGKGNGDRCPVSVLSNRELEVFQLVGRGLGTRDIAERLYLSVKTIETHYEHIKQKLVLKNSRELAIYASQWAETAKL